MNVVSSVLILLGAFVAVLAGIGILRFSTPYARFHAAGKASPVAFVITALGAAIVAEEGAGILLFSAIAMVLTLPVGVHLLFRAAYRTTNNDHLTADELDIYGEHA